MTLSEVKCPPTNKSKGHFESPSTLETDISSFCLRVENRTHEIPFLGLHHVHRCVSTRGSCPLFLGFIMFIVVFRPGGHVHPHCLATYFTHARTLKAFVCKVLRNGLLRYILYTCPQPNVTRVQSATEWTASVHTLHMPAT